MSELERIVYRYPSMYRTPALYDEYDTQLVPDPPTEKYTSLAFAWDVGPMNNAAAAIERIELDLVKAFMPCSFLLVTCLIHGQTGHDRESRQNRDEFALAPPFPCNKRGCANILRMCCQPLPHGRGTEEREVPINGPSGRSTR